MHQSIYVYMYYVCILYKYSYSAYMNMSPSIHTCVYILHICYVMTDTARRRERDKKGEYRTFIVVYINLCINA